MQKLDLKKKERIISFHRAPFLIVCAFLLFIAGVAAKENLDKARKIKQYETSVKEMSWIAEMTKVEFDPKDWQTPTHLKYKNRPSYTHPNNYGIAVSALEGEPIYGIVMPRGKIAGWYKTRDTASQIIIATAKKSYIEWITSDGEKYF